ncbi:hypothetical protein EUX98_g3187 [Antrodiella citrinella]|uniref:DUF6535 domain-containing protein n=1 Tax=Antrodiella citrinella TaxID=2447956 RepID=A0A4S4MYD9_9APHY|nr:hypothetical protein EUX98_g3187 [Antrodiella citrinella]
MSTPATPTAKKTVKGSIFDFHINTTEKPTKGDRKEDSDDDGSIDEGHGPGNSAEGWSSLSKTMTEYDEVKIKDCKEDMDTLLVFAGLFSAVLTAFNIELYRTLQADPTQMTVFVLTQMSQQLNSFTVNSGFVNATQPFLIMPPTFQPSVSSIRINILWFCSLDMDPAVGWVVTALIMVWLILYVSTTLAPAFSSRCPYKTPLLKEPLQAVQRRFHRWRKRNDLTSSRESRDERLLRMDQTLDIPALVAADATLQDDEFLEKTIRTCLVESDGNEVEQCVSQIISSRAGADVQSLAKIHVSDLQKLSNMARYTTVHILLDALDREIDGREREKRKVELLPWMRSNLICVGSALLPVYLAAVTNDGVQHEQIRAGNMVTRLISLNEDVARDTLEVLAFSSYQRLPSSFTISQITANQVMTNLIAGARACIAAKTVEPIQLCQAVLYLSTHFHNEGLREEWYHLNKLLTELSAAIEERLRLILTFYGTWRKPLPRNYDISVDKFE